MYWTDIIDLNTILANLEEKASCLYSNIKKMCKLWKVFNRLVYCCDFYRRQIGVLDNCMKSHSKVVQEWLFKQEEAMKGSGIAVSDAVFL